LPQLEEATMASAPTPATPAAEALLGALADRPRATVTQLAEAAGIGRSTAGKLLATLAAQGHVLRQPGGHKDGRRAADRWLLPTPAPTQDHGLPAPAEPAAPAEQPPTASGRLRAGQLRQLVLGCLADRPGQALSPTAIAKMLDRSAGAVANALRVLAGQGVVVQTQAKPRRYTIADRGSDHADTAS
jgi:DNA-binding MarR family transcriptional regulator